MEANQLLTCSKEMSKEYCATVVRIGEVHNIEGADKIGMTLVNGFSVVVAKADTHEGDIMFYAANETQLNEEFLSVNNQFEMSERHRNANYEDVQALLNSVDELTSQEEIDSVKAQAKSMVGFFNKHGRVKMITLRKQPSYGYLISIEAMAKFCPKIKDVDLTQMIGQDFDTVDGKPFIKVYVPPTIGFSSKGNKMGKHQRKIDRFDRLIPGEFQLHYDTAQLNREIGKIEPTDVVTISVKEHGTSGIFGNVRTRIPHKFDVGFKLGSWIVNKVYELCVPPSKRRYDIEQGNIYSSRTVIKNQYINPKVNDGFYGEDVWHKHNECIKQYIPQNTILYGEIVGFTDGGQHIQKGYDYGCKPRQSKLMPYRMVTNTEEGKKEWNVLEVQEWTMGLISEHPELQETLMPIEILYHGTLVDLYPTIPIDQHWHENILEAMKKDKRLGMEELEPLCKNRVPREGVVIRIDDDVVSEAFKLKCSAYMVKESKELDSSPTDIEMAERYS